MKDLLIVSRHPAAIEFIRAECPDFADAPVLASATTEDVKDKIVAGNLPLSLASAASAVIAVEFSGAPPRGQEYSAEDMRAAGARLALYVVRNAWGAYGEHGVVGNTFNAAQPGVLCANRDGMNWLYLPATAANRAAVAELERLKEAARRSGHQRSKCPHWRAVVDFWRSIEAGDATTT